MFKTFKISNMVYFVTSNQRTTFLNSIRSVKIRGSVHKDNIQLDFLPLSLVPQNDYFLKVKTKFNCTCT